jgi:hypothetical protein
MAEPLIDTPQCDACHSYYSESYCDDCALNICTWCSMKLHEPIGKRNHDIRRLYIDGYMKQQMNQDKNSKSSSKSHIHTSSSSNLNSSSSNQQSQQQLNRVSVLTSAVLQGSVSECWSLVSQFDLSKYLPDIRCETKDKIDTDDESKQQSSSQTTPTQQSECKYRILYLSGGIEINEELLEKDDARQFYRFRRLNGMQHLYDDCISKLSLQALNSNTTTAATTTKSDDASLNKSTQCRLLWLTSARPADDISIEEVESSLKNTQTIIQDAIVRAVQYRAQQRQQKQQQQQSVATASVASN